jgi:hypothetical protein
MDGTESSRFTVGVAQPILNRRQLQQQQQRRSNGTAVCFVLLFSGAMMETIRTSTGKSRKLYSLP